MRAAGTAQYQWREGMGLQDMKAKEHIYIKAFLTQCGDHSSSASCFMPPKDDRERRWKVSQKNKHSLLNKSKNKVRKVVKKQVRDKLNKLVLFDKATADKLCKGFPTAAYNSSCHL